MVAPIDASPPTSLPPDLEARLVALSALHDPVRRSLYLFALGAARAVGRDEAAEAVGVRRSLAAFHLDRLAADGLLAVEFRRLTGRAGPGAGRPAKLYRPAADDHEVSVPPRSYALVADLLAEAVEAGRPGGGGPSPEEVAGRRGEEIGRAARAGMGPRPATAALRDRLTVVLAGLGYQPAADAGTSRLRNCPFHAVAESHRPLVCAMNEAFVAGLLRGLGLRRLVARPDPETGRCCVVVGPGTPPGPV